MKQKQAYCYVRIGRIVQGKWHKLINIKRVLVHYYVLKGTVSKIRAHVTTLKIEVILYLLRGARIQTH